MSENAWTDKHLYEEAERRFYEKKFGTGQSKQCDIEGTCAKISQLQILKDVADGIKSGEKLPRSCDAELEKIEVKFNEAIQDVVSCFFDMVKLLKGSPSS